MSQRQHLCFARSGTRKLPPARPPPAVISPLRAPVSFQGRDNKATLGCSPWALCDKSAPRAVGSFYSNQAVKFRERENPLLTGQLFHRAGAWPPKEQIRSQRTALVTEVEPLTTNIVTLK